MQAYVATTFSASDTASRCILRLALGTGMSMAFSQLVGWPLSYISAVFTMFLLALPLPPAGWKSVFKFSAAIVAPAYLGMLLLPFMLHARWAGIILVILSLFGSFYYSARGGSSVLGMFMTIGLTLVVTVGSVSPEAMKFVVDGIAVSAIADISYVVIAHVLLSDVRLRQGADAKLSQTSVTPSREKARKNALRSLSVVLPLVLIFLFIGTSTSYVVIMIKVASMGQQASVEDTRAMGRQQLQSTLWAAWGVFSATS